MVHALCFLFLPVLLCAQSKPPSPSPPKSTQEQQSERTNEQYGQNPSQPSVSVSVNNSRDTDEQKNAPAPSDGWITIFTAILAITAVFQYFIYRKQTQVMADALAETKVAADAAKVSAEVAKRTLEVAHRARVGISSITLVDPSLEMRPLTRDALSNCYVEIILVNAGPTLARAFTFNYEISIYGLGDVMNQPLMIACGPTEIHPSIPFERRSLPMHLLFPDANVLWTYAVNGKNLTVAGNYSYWDIFGKHLTASYSATIVPAAVESTGGIRVDFEVNTESNPNNYS